MQRKSRNYSNLQNPEDGGFITSAVHDKPCGRLLRDSVPSSRDELTPRVSGRKRVFWGWGLCESSLVSVSSCPLSAGGLFWWAWSSRRSGHVTIRRVRYPWVDASLTACFCCGELGPLLMMFKDTSQGGRVTINKVEGAGEAAVRPRGNREERRREQVECAW